MSSPPFVKGACGHCGGHIEFPAAATGQAIPCPHCGRPTVLTPATPALAHPRTARIWWAAAAGACCLAAATWVAFYWSQKLHVDALTAPAPQLKPMPQPTPGSNAPTLPPPVHLAAPAPQPEALTNDFALLPFKLEKTSGSSLVYVTGTVRNLSDQQRFGVKVEFRLFDTNDISVGTATDYQSVLDPHAEWHFKAMVMASRTASARFGSIAEEK